MNKRKVIYAIAVAITTSAFTLIGADFLVKRHTQKKHSNDISALPHRKAGLVLGTSKTLSDGQTNLYYAYRIDAAVKLMEMGKVDCLILSGDNHVKSYNEPETMRADLIARGIDSTKIVLDYAGFRTLDSVVRLKEIFSQDSAIVISQAFHNERAIYLASLEGVDLVGYDAQDVPNALGVKVQMREKFARVKVFVDYLFGVDPKFLGEKVALP
jgi:SanA protein